MRLRDMQKIIDENLNLIDKVGIQEVNGMFRITKYNAITPHLQQLAKLRPFTKEVDELFSTEPFYPSSVDMFTVSNSQMSFLQNKIKTIFSIGETLLTAFDQIITPQPENTLSFKLYDFEDFGSFTAFCNDLNVKILAPINRLKIPVHLSQLEEGSQWLSIAAESGVALLILSSIIRQAYDILIHDHQKYKVMDDLIQTLGDDRESIEKIRASITNRRNKEISERIDTIMLEVQPSIEQIDSISQEELRELKNAVTISTQLFTTHIDKGLEIYQALDKQQDERYRLPDFKKLLIGNKETKAINKLNA